MAICKHISSHNYYYDPLEYTTMQHDSKRNLLLDTNGFPIPRTEYLIDGINCYPETFAPLCLRDNLYYRKRINSKTITMHQYIISFSSDDTKKGLTPEEAQSFGLKFARKNFSGHRVLVCTHIDGHNHSNNIHVHIIVCSLRFQDRDPDPQFMRLQKDGNVRPSAYKAGYAHQDTAKLRIHLLRQVNSYCLSKGYAICPEKSSIKISQKEYAAKSANIETWKDQLRRTIDDAAATSICWEDFVDQLHHNYTQFVPVIPPLSAAVSKKLSSEFQRHQAAFTRLQKPQSAEPLIEKIWETYTQSFFLMLESHNREDAASCLDKMHSLIISLSKADDPGTRLFQFDTAEYNRVLEYLANIKEDAAARKLLDGVMEEIPLPILVKLSKGYIYYLHPQAKHWIRGMRLGKNYTLDALGFQPTKVRNTHRRSYDTFSSR